MTLRELLLSVDGEQYADSQLYQELLKVKPEYGWVPLGMLSLIV